MERFAFVLHPLEPVHFSWRFAFTRWFPPRWVEEVFKLLPPMELSHITGIRSPVGSQAEGWLIGLPLTPRTLLESDLRFVYHRLIQCARLAERLGARILGLGAFTKVVGDAGVTVAANTRLAVTTGNSYTAATAIEGALRAADRMGISLSEARAAVVGATGAIGSVCARILARQVPSLVLVARNRKRLEALRERILGEAQVEVTVSMDPRTAVGDADIILAVTSAPRVLLEPDDLKPGAVVCDVARPRNVSQAVYQHRDDVLVIDGSVIEVPGEAEFGFDFGYPPRTCEACMAETMILALEGRYESFSLGRDLTVEQVQEIARLANKHGFRLAAFRRLERTLPEEEVDRIRDRARGVGLAGSSRSPIMGTARSTRG
ncbi:MAG: shikimate dehydrogenase [Armatimonadetes bacterium]|nr:shikimate dehydrogenase [Armatimonadota bacterium]MDW8154118.1 shikimate dehydrogenase [Armatimonadota bacterium]